MLAGLRPRAVLADRGYDSDAIVALVSASGAVAVIPGRSKLRKRNPRSIDRNLYRRRNVVERTIGRLKNNRRIATRYDKTDQNFEAFLHIACSLLNLNNTVNTA